MARKVLKERRERGEGGKRARKRREEKVRTWRKKKIHEQTTERAVRGGFVWVGNGGGGGEA